MNKILIVDASDSDRRLMSNILLRSGYEPLVVGTLDATKEQIAKLPPGAVVVAAMKFTGGTAQELINWLKTEGYRFPVIAVVENLNGLDAVEVMQDHGAIAVVQRPATTGRSGDFLWQSQKNIPSPYVWLWQATYT